MADPLILPPNNISEHQLRRALWIAEHRLLLKRISIGVLIAIGAGSWLFTIWGAITHFLIEGPALRRAVNAVAVSENANAPFLAALRPQLPHIADVLLIPSGGTTYDAAARIVNPNPRWLLDMEYALDIPGAPSVSQHAVVLPGRERWLSRFNAESSQRPVRATLTIGDIRWRRIGSEEAIDVERFIRDRFDIEIADASYLPPGSAAPVVGAPPAAPTISRAVFTVRNRSAYAIRDLELTVLLRRGGSIVGVNRITIEGLASGEVRPAAATWFRPIGLVQSVDVHPFVNVFDPEAFDAPS